MVNYLNVTFTGCSCCITSWFLLFLFSKCENIAFIFIFASSRCCCSSLICIHIFLILNSRNSGVFVLMFKFDLLDWIRQQMQRFYFFVLLLPTVQSIRFHRLLFLHWFDHLLVSSSSSFYSNRISTKNDFETKIKTEKII